MKQITDTILMVRPRNFGFNPVTAVNNQFQSSEGEENEEEIKLKAREEFDRLVEKLRSVGVKVEVFDDLPRPQLPDSVFPNNWITFHQEGWVITYPMFSEIRSKERREDIVQAIQENYGIDRRYSFEYYEEEGMYLEGTGSMILDRRNKIVYACVSARTDPQLLNKWAVLNNYRTIIFHAFGDDGIPIYHTNVIMAMGEDFVIICLDCIPQEEEKKELEDIFKQTGKKIIAINFEQVKAFAGNMLQVRAGFDRYLVMSTQAYLCLPTSLISEIEKFTKTLHSDIATIEKYGGGSVRCMMAEIFYPEMV